MMMESSQRHCKPSSSTIPLKPILNQTSIRYPTRRQVEIENQRRLQQLRGDPKVYRSKDGPDGGNRAEQQKKLLDNFMASDTVTLKIDAQVMMIKNIDDTLVNGSMGRVIGFCKETEFQITKTGSWRGEVGGINYEDSENEELGEDGLSISKPKPRSSIMEEELPVVSFMMPGGGVRDCLVKRETFKVEAPNGEILAQRSQVSYTIKLPEVMYSP
jgi:ATP-dependent DNA helicase PIF1